MSRTQSTKGARQLYNNRLTTPNRVHSRVDNSKTLQTEKEITTYGHDMSLYPLQRR